MGVCAPMEDYSTPSAASTIRRRGRPATEVDMDREALGRLIRSRRETQGLTLRGLAERAGVSHAYIGAIENSSNHGNLTLAALSAIAAGLGDELHVSIGPRPPIEYDQGVHAARSDLVRRASIALASLPDDELEQEARILELRAARHVREPEGQPYEPKARRQG